MALTLQLQNLQFFLHSRKPINSTNNLRNSTDWHNHTIQQPIGHQRHHRSPNTPLKNLRADTRRNSQSVQKRHPNSYIRLLQNIKLFPQGRPRNRCHLRLQLPVNSQNMHRPSPVRPNMRRHDHSHSLPTSRHRHDSHQR